VFFVIPISNFSLSCVVNPLLPISETFYSAQQLFTGHVIFVFWFIIFASTYPASLPDTCWTSLILELVTISKSSSVSLLSAGNVRFAKYSMVLFNSKFTLSQTFWYNSLIFAVCKVIQQLLGSYI